MRYFTEALLERFGSVDDAIADAAQAEWDRTSDAYRDHLNRLRPILPKDLRTLLDHYPLHDARVTLRSLDRGGETYTIRLTPLGGPPLVLTYGLAASPELGVSGPVAAQQEPCHWLYDELDATAGVLQHDILFSDGTELRLRFTTFSMR